MKRIANLRSILLLCVIALTLVATGCVKKHISKYESKTPSEKAIVKTIIGYQDIINSYNWDNIPQLFTSDGKIATQPVEEWIASNKEMVAKFKKHNCQLNIKAPDSIKVSGQTAYTETFRTVSCSDSTLTMLFDFKNVDGQWKIANLNSK